MKNVENLVFFTRLLAWVISVPTTLIKVITRIIFLTLRSVLKTFLCAAVLRILRRKQEITERIPSWNTIHNFERWKCVLRSFSNMIN